LRKIDILMCLFSCVKLIDHQNTKAQALRSILSSWSGHHPRYGFMGIP